MKVLHCSDAGFDCQAVVKADTEREVLSQAAVHAEQVHGMKVTPEMERELSKLVKDEKEESVNSR